MNKYAVIDMGTNSVRLMLAEVKERQLVNVTKELEMTRLGEGVDATRQLSERSMAATVDAIKAFKAKAEAFGAQSLKTIATSAVRDAENRDAFVERVLRETGVDIDVISGAVEAELGFKGVMAGLERPDQILVVDIGGGSTEFIVGNEHGIAFSVSENVGAVRMTGKHLLQDPVDAKENKAMVADIDQIVESTMASLKQQTFHTIVGIGGTLTTISAMLQEMEQYDPTRIQNSVVSKRDIDKLLERMKPMKNDERKKIKGLAPKRADIIYAGMMIMERVLTVLEKEALIISDYDNLEGALFEYLI